MKNLKKFNEKKLEPNEECKQIAIEFAKWLGDNKWFKQKGYDQWEKSGMIIKKTSALFDMFINDK